MPFENGSLAVTFFELLVDLPENFHEKFAVRRAGTLDSVSKDPEDDAQLGWVARHVLDTEITDVSVHRGRFVSMMLRKAKRQVPASLLQAVCRREEQAYLTSKQADFVPSKVRKQIKQDAVAKLLPMMPPSLSSIPFVIDPAAKMLYLGTGSQAAIDLFIEQFAQTIKIEPLQWTPASILAKDFDTTESAFPAVSFCGVRDTEPVIGRDFLTWLWYFSENGGKADLGQDGEFELLIEAPLVFADSGEATGAEETVVKKGNSPQRSAEAKAALATGKKLKKAGFTMARGQEMWTGTFDADRFSFSGLKLPDGEMMAPDERFQERMEFLLLFENAWAAYFKTFAETMLGGGLAGVETKLKKWSSSRDAV